MRIVRAHSFRIPREPSPFQARRFLAQHGAERAAALVAHKRADLLAKNVEAWELPALAAFEQELAAQHSSPHRLSDLAVDGGDLLSEGFEQGPALGRALQALLDEVVEEPSRNTREWLLARAGELR